MSENAATARTQFEHAVFAEALRRSSVLWIHLPAVPVPRAAWHVWVDGAAAVVHEGGEQQLPGLQDLTSTAAVVRSKDSGALLVEGFVRVVPLLPGDARWSTATAALHAARQSPPDGERQPARWARHSRITRLEPTGPITQSPGHYDPGGRWSASWNLNGAAGDGDDPAPDPD